VVRRHREHQVHGGVGVRRRRLRHQLGTRGGLQFGVIAQRLQNVESGGSNGFENDNSEFGFNNGPPFNEPKYCNVDRRSASTVRRARRRRPTRSACSAGAATRSASTTRS
jgi:hypothetical protein